MNHELEKFIKIVEMESFSQAAEELHVSQPALSIAIKNLEKELGYELIVRGGGDFQLTEAGKIVYDSAGYIELENRNMATRLDDLKQGRNVFARIGMIDSLAEQLFSLPDVDPLQMEVVIESSSKLVERLKMGRLDLAFIVHQDEITDKKLMVEPVGAEKFALVASPDRIGSLRKELKECKINDFLAYNKDSTTYSVLSKSLKSKKIVTNNSFHLNRPDLLKAMVVSGKGVSLLPRSLVRGDIRWGNLKEISSLRISRQIDAIWRMGQYISPVHHATIKRTVSLLSH